MITILPTRQASVPIYSFRSFILLLSIFFTLVSYYSNPIDDFRGACAVKGNVPVAGRTSSVSNMEMLSTHDVTSRNVDGSLFHIKIWFVMGHQDQNGQNWRNISQFTMWVSQSGVYIYKTYQSLYQFQHFAAKCDSAMYKWSLPQ